MEITPNQAYEHFDKFKLFYDPVTQKRSLDIRDDIRITVWFKDDEGFVVNAFVDEIGITVLVATSWIEHYELERLCAMASKSM